MYLYNSATHKKEEFKTHTPGHVEMYTCGPTVYHFAHIGNLRSYIMEDVLEKYLRYIGYPVKRVMSRTNVDKNITESVDYTLVDADGNEVDTTDLTTDVDTIEVELDVVKYKQVPLSVNFIDGGGATGADADVDIDPKSITLAGDATVLDSVNTIVLGNVDLGATDNNAVLSFDIKIPNDAKNVSGEESATVTIKIKNKRTKVIGATNIAFINTPDGFDARSITQLVQTTVRASNTEIDRIAANNLRVVADLSEYTQAGTYQVPVTIYIDGYPDAGVIGDDYKIVVVLEAVE